MNKKPKPLRCEICGKGFVDLEELWITAEPNEQQWACEDCADGYYQALEADDKDDINE